MKTAGALICFLVASLAFAAPPRPRKIVLIAGPKSHGPGAHEYLKSVKLLKALLDRSPNGGPVTTEIYFNSWPEHPETLDTADTVVIISEGQPGDTNPPVPYVIPERMKVLEKQMQCGCGIVTIHYTTFITYAYVDEILEWQGGYYEWKGPPERRSAIKTLETDVKLGVPQHPISNGLRDFKLKDEYYYKLRFRPNDPKLKPILQVPALSDDPEQQIVAWAVERQGGGRGFSTTTGHFFENWKNDSYRKLMLNAVLWTSGTDVPPGGVESTYVDEQAVDQALMVSPIPALVVTSDPKRSACIVSALTSETRRFQVKIADSLERENLNRNKLILLTESNPRDKAHLTRYMKHGGGVALVHIPPGTDNEPSGVYRIRVAADHPITHNVAAFETTDRLSTGGPDASDSRVLATAQSKDGGEEQPVAFVSEHSRARIFQTTLGGNAAGLQNRDHAMNPLRQPMGGGKQIIEEGILNLLKLPIVFGMTAVFLFAQEPRFPSGAPKRPAPAAPVNFFGLAPPPDPAAVARGQALFVTNCGFCHGSLAKGGNAGPDLVRSVLVLHDEGSGTEIGPVILNGRPAKGMPKFALTAEQIKDIAAFLLSRSQATVKRGEYQLLDLVTGDPKAGLTYFNAHCASCHSPTGDLAHIAGKYEPPALQARFLYPRTRIAEKAQLTVTVTLPSGKSYNGLLNSIDDFNVAMTDASGEYHSWQLDESKGIKVVVHDPLAGHEELLKHYTNTDMHNVLAYLETLK
jgi:mono/diheme cytochrome c family protein/type 1 glutamine amidotransferase